MRRIFLTAVVGLVLGRGEVRADDPLVQPLDEGIAVGEPHFEPNGGPYVAPQFGSFYDFDGGYGRRLRGGFGRNGYAPVVGPLWGPAAFVPAAPASGRGHLPVVRRRW